MTLPNSSSTNAVPYRSTERMVVGDNRRLVGGQVDDAVAQIDALFPDDIP
jgi:hypothetical protein